MMNEPKPRIPITALATAVLALAAWMAPAAPSAAADDRATPYAGAAVSVEKPKKQCFRDAVSISGVLVPREDVLVRPEREGMTITSVLVEAGDTVTSGQVLAKLTAPEGQPGGGTLEVRAPSAGLVLKTSAVLGSMASMRADPMFQIAAHSEVELLAQLSSSDLARVARDQIATINVIGVGEVKGRVRLVLATVDAMTQLGQVRIFLGKNDVLRVGAFGSGVIVTGERCGLSIPLSAILYSQDTAFVALVRNNRIETRQVVIGMLSEGAVEVRQGLAENDQVVVRAGAFVREGDLVRPVPLGAPARK